jgi:hypothetical protein
MAGIESLDRMAGSLQVYDVEQGGWQFNKSGLVFNAGHVLTHLAGDQIRKDFSNPEVVKREIAPDAIAYALRLVRWTRSTFPDVFINPEDASLVNGLSQRIGGIKNLGRAAWEAATGWLGMALHDTQHSETANEAKSRIAVSLRKPAGALLYCANTYVGQYGFDIEESFAARLEELRERFGIPQLVDEVPEKVGSNTGALN